MSKQVFNSVATDYTTGEVKETRSVVVSQFKTRFMMINLTEGTEKFHTLTGNEIKLCIEFLNIENKQSNLVSLSPDIKAKIINAFDFSETYYRKVLNSLENKGIIAKKTRLDYVVNPAYFYIGSTNDIKAKLEKFNKFAKIKQSDF